MANTYYDSALTGEQIEAVLEAIDGVVSASNNNKVLAISGGKIVARSVQWGGSTPTIEELSVTENGTYTAPSGVDGYSPITVNVPSSEPTIEALTVTENGTYTPSTGVDGYAPVTVNVPSSGGTIEALEITENGTYTASGDVDGYSPITVDVPTDAKIYLGDDPNYYTSKGNVLICNLYGHSYIHSYIKVNEGFAYIAYYYRKSGYTDAIVVSENADAVTMNKAGKEFEYGGTIIFNDKTYYYCSAEYAQAGNITSSSGIAKKLDGTIDSQEAAAQALLELAVGTYPNQITSNGSYSVPSDYDGYGDLEVNVPSTAVQLTQEEYDALETKDPNALYAIVEES